MYKNTAAQLQCGYCVSFDSAPTIATRFAAMEDMKASEGHCLIKDVCGHAGVRCIHMPKKELSSSEEALPVWLAAK